MKLLYLGTGASEGIPAVFCSCPVCMEARVKKGRNIRTRSQALLDGTVLFDFPPDSFLHYIASGFRTLDLPAIRHLFITHSHMDHFYANELHMRRPVFVASRPVEILHVYGNKTVEEIILNLQRIQNSAPCNDFHHAKPFEPIEFDGYRITPFTALHDQSEECLFYAAEHNGKTLLYAHDTGFFPEPVWEYLSRVKFHFDLVSLDCTFSDKKDGRNHMGIPDCVDVRGRLAATGAADSNTVYVLSHFSHNGGLNHDDLCRAAANEKFIVAYDGMEIEV